MPGRDRVTPEGKVFFKQIEELKKLQVRVGFQQGDASEEGVVDLVDIAVWNEMGTEYIPPRPFLRQSVDTNAAEIAATCRRLLSGIVKGRLMTRDALEKIGAMQKGIIQRTIKEGGFTPNAPITIEGGWLRRKGGKAVYIKGKGSPATPLIDSGRMRQSVNFVITEKGGD